MSLPSPPINAVTIQDLQGNLQEVQDLATSTVEATGQPRNIKEDFLTRLGRVVARLKGKFPLPPGNLPPGNNQTKSNDRNKLVYNSFVASTIIMIDTLEAQIDILNDSTTTPDIILKTSRKFTIIFNFFKILCIKIQAGKFRTNLNLTTRNTNAGDIAAFSKLIDDIFKEEIDVFNDDVRVQASIAQYEAAAAAAAAARAAQGAAPLTPRPPPAPQGAPQPQPDAAEAARRTAAEAAEADAKLVKDGNGISASVPTTKEGLEALIDIQNLKNATQFINTITESKRLKTGFTLTDTEKKTLLLFKKYVTYSKEVVIANSKEITLGSRNRRKFTSKDNMIIAFSEDGGGFLQLDPVNLTLTRDGVVITTAKKAESIKRFIYLGGLTDEQYDVMVLLIGKVQDIFQNKIIPDGWTFGRGAQVTGGRRAKRRTPMKKTRGSRKATRRNRRS